MLGGRLARRLAGTRQRHLLYRVVVQRRVCTIRRDVSNKKPRGFAGLLEERLKGLEPSPFCMAMLGLRVDFR